MFTKIVQHTQMTILGYSIMVVHQAHDLKDKVQFLVSQYIQMTFSHLDLWCNGKHIRL